MEKDIANLTQQGLDKCKFCKTIYINIIKTIFVTEGKYNYFRYSFDADVSNAKFDKTVRTTSSIFDGDINAVEMVDYNQSEDDLYITFKQVADDLGSFAKFKLLFYKGDKIVYTEDGYFSVYAENLTGKDTTNDNL